MEGYHGRANAHSLKKIKDKNFITKILEAKFHFKQDLELSTNLCDIYHIQSTDKT